MATGRGVLMVRKNRAEDQHSETPAENQTIEELLHVMDKTDWSGIMMICIYGQTGNRIFGTIVNRCLNGPVSFCGLDQLILKIDEICELSGMPRRTMNPRFLQEEMRERYAELSEEREKRARKKPDGWKGMSNVLKRQIALTKEFLEIQILFRDNATMQGRLRCQLSNRKYVSFRSALELFRMLKEVETRFCENSRPIESDFDFTDLSGKKEKKRGKAIS